MADGGNDDDDVVFVYVHIDVFHDYRWERRSILSFSFVTTVKGLMSDSRHCGSRCKELTDFVNRSIQAAVKTEDPSLVATTLSLSRKNGVIKQYGVLQSDLTAMPPNPTGRVRCPDGKTRTREERLIAVPDVPTDDRGIEIFSALSVLSFGGFDVFSNWIGLDDIYPYTNALAAIMILVGVVDNFYDVISFTARMMKDKVEINVPEKGSLPLGLGTGKTTGTVVRGLIRVTSPETLRECECEAAAFYAAYTLGLPCFAFRPNALEGAVLVAESLKTASSGGNKQNNSNDQGLDPLLSNIGIMKMLVWIMSPAAMESSKHPQLIVSDPREGEGLLVRLEDRSELLVDGKGSPIDLWWTDGGSEEGDAGKGRKSPAAIRERLDMIKWAYTEADLLLRNNKGTVDELTDRLASGAATIGDLVAVVEGW